MFCAGGTPRHSEMEVHGLVRRKRMRGSLVWKVDVMGVLEAWGGMGGAEGARVGPKANHADLYCVVGIDTRGSMRVAACDKEIV